MNALNSNQTLRQQLDSSHVSLDAKERLETLRQDSGWLKRYFAGDHEAQAECDFLVWQMNRGDEPFCCLMPEPMSAADMRDDAELKYDSTVPNEVLNAIAAQEKIERDNARFVSVMQREPRGCRR